MEYFETRGLNVFLFSNKYNIHSTLGKLMFFDGRNIEENGWFLVRSWIPANKTGKVVEWHLMASTIKKRTRKPVIEISQFGYYPTQEKRAVIELDKHVMPLKIASLYRVTPQGNSEKVFTGLVKKWGQYFRYSYVTFKFTSKWNSGTYYIKYGNKKLNVGGGFIIKNMEWKNRELESVSIVSTLGGNCRLRTNIPIRALGQTRLRKDMGPNPNPFFQPGPKVKVVISPEAKLPFLPIPKTYVYDFPAKVGRTYTFIAKK